MAKVLRLPEGEVVTEDHQLRERAKELRCLYEINEAASDRAKQPSQVFLRVLEIIPQGWQRPNTTGARIEYLNRSFVGPGFSSAGHLLKCAIRLWDTEVGHIEVSDAAPDADPDRPFLAEEQQLLNTIAQRLGEYLEWKQTQLLGERFPPVGGEWQWRQAYAEAIAKAMDAGRFGVTRLFLGGSTATGHAGPGSDIDLVVEFNGSDDQRSALTLWFEGWSLCLAELAARHNGYRAPGGLLDITWIKPGTDPRTLSDFVELALGEAAP